MEAKKRKKPHPLVIALIVLVILALLLCATVLGLWLHGRNSIHKPVEMPSLPQQEQNDTSADQSSQGSFVEYQGKRYQYNENMINILLMGIDSDKETATSANDGYDQADVLVLVALNLASNEMTLISLNRDTICDIQLVDPKGNPTALMNTQLALAYAYGDGQYQSCELTRDAVSNLFFGLPIQGYGAYYLNGVAELNDAVGGVTVTILDDYPFTYMRGHKNMIAGHQVTLKGIQAKSYIQCRLETRTDANALRMQRQKQYMLALINQAKQLLKKNPAAILGLYNSVDDYILTNLDIGEIGYLGSKAASMDFSGDIRSVTGEFTVGADNHIELHVDRESLYDLMLDVFYTEVTQ